MLNRPSFTVCWFDFEKVLGLMQLVPSCRTLGPNRPGTLAWVALSRSVQRMWAGRLCSVVAYVLDVFNGLYDHGLAGERIFCGWLILPDFTACLRHVKRVPAMWEKRHFRGATQTTAMTEERSLQAEGDLAVQTAVIHESCEFGVDQVILAQTWVAPK